MNPNYTLTFTPEELAILNKALMEQPFKDVVGIINNINRQLAEQSSSQEHKEPS